MPHLLRTADLSPAQFVHLVELAQQFKTEPHKNREILRGETVMLYFNKPSTRTRLSCETAITRLGGTPITCNAQDLQLGRGESIADTARVVSRYCRAFIIRTFKDEEVQQFAESATIPVINALTDNHHPLQSLADLLTLKEKSGGWAGKKIAYVGDGNNNVAHSLLEGAVLTGMDIAVATPSAYALQPAIVQQAQKIAAHTGSRILLTADPVEAAKNADAVYTDVWLSMNTPPEERQARVHALMPYQVNAQLMQYAKPEAIFMHCLPAHRGEEVTAEIIDGRQSVVFDQAENRLFTAQAVLLYLLLPEKNKHF